MANRKWKKHCKRRVTFYSFESIFFYKILWFHGFRNTNIGTKINTRTKPTKVKQADDIRSLSVSSFAHSVWNFQHLKLSFCSAVSVCLQPFFSNQKPKNTVTQFTKATIAKIRVVSGSPSCSFNVKFSKNTPVPARFETSRQLDTRAVAIADPWVESVICKATIL